MSQNTVHRIGSAYAQGDDLGVCQESWVVYSHAIRGRIVSRSTTGHTLKDPREILAIVGAQWDRVTLVMWGRCSRKVDVATEIFDRIEGVHKGQVVDAKVRILQGQRLGQLEFEIAVRIAGHRPETGVDVENVLGTHLTAGEIFVA